MKSKKTTMAWKLLEWIGSKSTVGASLTEIQYYIWTVLENKCGKEFWENSKPSYIGAPETNQRKTRGHWNTALYGGVYYHGGLLHLYCVKLNGKWVLNKMPSQYETIYKKKNIKFNIF